MLAVCNEVKRESTLALYSSLTYRRRHCIQLVICACVYQRAVLHVKYYGEDTLLSLI